MQMIEYSTQDKTGWGPGPWQEEPDKKQWQDLETGIPCLIVRNRAGNLCGYVGVTEDHPWFGLGYSSCRCTKTEDEYHYECHPEGQIDVHGGLTYADFCQPGDEAKTICHLPDPGEPDHVWWFGFDTAHSGDLTPSYYRDVPALIRGTYRDMTYIMTEVKQLAKQLKARYPEEHEPVPASTEP